MGSNRYPASSSLSYKVAPRRRRAAMSMMFGISRRVGVWAARKRARPASSRACSSDPSGQGERLADAGLDRLVPVEPGVLVQKRPAEPADHGTDVATVDQVVVDDRAGTVDLTLGLETVIERGEGLGGVGQTRRRDVEKPVLVDAQRTVHDTTKQFWRGLAREWLRAGRWPS